MLPWFRFVFMVQVLSFGSLAFAQQSYPMLMSIEPVSTQIGATTEHVVKSRYSMENAYQVLVSGEGVFGEVVLPAPKEGKKTDAALLALTVRFTVDSAAVPGVREFRIATPNGVSTTGQLVVAHDPLLSEDGDNNEASKANDVVLPATICGKIEKAEDVDYFRFQVEANQTVNFNVRCMRLQDRIHDLQQHADPLLVIRNASGSTVVSMDNVFAADPFISHTFREAGDYYLEIRDVRFQGNQYWGYCIEANSRPFVKTVFPLAVNPDNSQDLELVGNNLGDSTRGSVISTLPGDEGIGEVLVSVASGTSQPVTIIRAQGDLRLEADQPNQTAEEAEVLDVPVALNGRIESVGDLDYYRFQAQKGDRFTVDVVARRAGSMLDPHLRILSETGSQIQLNDDFRIGKRTYADAKIENWVVPSDGEYLVEIRDVHLRGGDEFGYFLSVRRSEPHFELFADTDKTPLRPGTSGVVYVRVERKNGFDGEIQLGVEGLPEGVTATCGKILAGKRQDGCIVLTASADAKPLVKPIRIFGEAEIPQADASMRLVADATIYQEIYQPGGGRGHWPVESHVVSVGDPGDVLTVQLSTYDLVIKPGESQSVDVEIQRAPGFDKNVTLEVIYKHLSSVFGDPLPEGITVDASASKLLLTSGATKGKITFKASETAPPTSSQVLTVMANVSLNFVMKATYASDPMRITVESK